MRLWRRRLTIYWRPGGVRPFATGIRPGLPGVVDLRREGESLRGVLRILRPGKQRAPEEEGNASLYERADAMATQLEVDRDFKIASEKHMKPRFKH